MRQDKTQMINGFPFVPYRHQEFSPMVTLQRATEFYQWADQRRTVREFSSKPVAREVIDQLILTASTAPSGAHKQPWTFVVVTNPAIKKEIRVAAEHEEQKSYQGRMSAEWIEDLKRLQTDWSKPFLETAPALVIVFKKAYDILPDGSKKTNYYVNESVGIACGFLLAAVHHAGLVALTHTPSPMSFLSKILSRPENERPFLLIPVGYQPEETLVPKLRRKPKEEVAIYL